MSNQDTKIKKNKKKRTVTSLTKYIMDLENMSPPLIALCTVEINLWIHQATVMAANLQK